MRRNGKTRDFEVRNRIADNWRLRVRESTERLRLEKRLRFEKLSYGGESESEMSKGGGVLWFDFEEIER